MTEEANAHQSAERTGNCSESHAPEHPSSRNGMQGKTRQVIFHRPSHAWVKGLDVLSQPGVAEHFGYILKLFENNQAIAAGPFTDAEPGGMLILHERLTQSEALAIAQSDPGVSNGLIDFQIRTWFVTLEANAMSMPEAIQTRGAAA